VDTNPRWWWWWWWWWWWSSHCLYIHTHYTAL